MLGQVVNEVCGVVHLQLLLNIALIRVVTGHDASVDPTISQLSSRAPMCSMRAVAPEEAALLSLSVSTSRVSSPAHFRMVLLDVDIHARNNLRHGQQKVVLQKVDSAQGSRC
jgi:hypothetical protein